MSLFEVKERLGPPADIQCGSILVSNPGSMLFVDGAPKATWCHRGNSVVLATQIVFINAVRVVAVKAEQHEDPWLGEPSSAHDEGPWRCLFFPHTRCVCQTETPLPMRARQALLGAKALYWQ